MARKTTKVSRKTRPAAAKAAANAIARLNTLRGLAVAKAEEARKMVVNGATEARARATDAVSRFEKVFEDRVTGVVAKLGVPTARDVRALSRQVAHLQQSVDQLRRSRARA